MGRLSIFVLLLSFVLPIFANEVPSCRHLLSQKTLAQRSIELHGGNPLCPTANSRLGQYLHQSGATTLIHRFAAGRDAELGPKKLVVAVSSTTFPLFKQMFGETFPILEHLHTPDQGTLIIRWKTQIFTYAQSRGDWRFPSLGTLGPMILLSSSEVGRLEDYVQLNRQGPSMFREPDQIPGYGYPRDAYFRSCTAWFGHIPLGDKTYNEVISNGSIDQYGDKAGPAPRRGRLRDYPLSGLPPELPVDRALVKKVWNPNLPIRLFDLLEVPGAFQNGNHTNPGWVVLTLTGLVGNERVPFVAYYTADHTQIPLPFDPKITLVGP